MRSFVSRLGAGILMCAFLCGNASALIDQHFITVNNGGANYQAGNSGSFELPKFNSALGTLTAVTLQITGNALGGHNWVDNESDVDSGNVDLELGAQISVTGPESLVVITLPKETASGFVTTDTDDAPDFAGTDFLGITSADASHTASSSPDDLASYIGTGNLTFNFTSSGNTMQNFHAPLTAMSFIDMGNSYFGLSSQNVQFNFDAILTYEYELNENGGGGAPEPGTLAMMAVVATAFGIAGRRKRTAK